MADPEVGLAWQDSKIGGETTGKDWSSSTSFPAQSPPEDSRHVSSELEKKSLDEGPRRDKDASSLDDANGIIELYLSFDTDLPAPYIEKLSDHARKNLPPAPSLAKFQSPLQWKSSRKTVILCLGCIGTCLTAFSAGGYSPGALQMEDEWHVSHTAILVGITMFTCGFGIAPMLLAPFSEINGRKPVFLITGILFALCQLFCAITRSYAGMLLARFFLGVGGSTFSTMVGGVVSDIYSARDRNAAMAVFSASAMFGTGLGPLICGFIAQHLSWRWQFYLQFIMDSTLVILIAVLFSETRGSVLLSRKGKALNAWYEKLEAAGCPGVCTPNSSPRRIRWKVASDEERASIVTMLRISISRPFHLLFTEPILFSFSLWVTFSWMVLYLTLAAIPLVYAEVYNFDIQSQGAMFASLCIAAILFTPITILQEKWAYKYNWFHFRQRSAAPEHRLIFSCVQSLLLPIGLFIFGWASRANISPAVGALGLMLATCGIFSIYLATFNYLADVYGVYASSALAAQSFCRNMAGGAIPLFTGAMYHKLGIGPASSVLGAIGLLLGVVPWVLLFWGERIRKRSPFAIGGKTGG
ncbi:MFS multidrug transporter-like protein [Microthyrium microscopicum]|uniref:MFS multidrug transporter-like protein n=1 Tax=Microthyrium microscopicum TaxID=703497 RepID=A0A6A6TXC0_9PEZI|nr:MFS multidrug transporter-like protein [Microthyrium microscopicum]